MTAHPFYSIHRHGWSASPPARRRDASAIPPPTPTRRSRWRTDGARSGADLLVFPELNLISSYAIDDLHLQDALQRATEAALAAIVAATRQAEAGAARRRGAARATGGSTIARSSIARGRILGVVPKTFLPNYREYYEKRWFASGARARPD